MSFGVSPRVQIFDSELFEKLGHKKMLLYNVMFVVPKGDVLVRVGVGQIHVEGWQRALPAAKQNLLT